jgi:hypothetical protein
MDCDKLKNGLRVRILELESTAGMFINPCHLDCRRAGITGTVGSMVGGHGGDVWFVQHDDSEEVGAYCYTELEELQTVKKSHTKEPWFRDWEFIYGTSAATGKPVRVADACECADDTLSDEEWGANSDRIVACVNALQGVDDPEECFAGILKDLKDALQWIEDTDDDPDGMALIVGPLRAKYFL